MFCFFVPQSKTIVLWPGANITRQRKLISQLYTSKSAPFYDTLPQVLSSNPQKFWQFLNPKPPDAIIIANHNDIAIPEHKSANAFTLHFHRYSPLNLMLRYLYCYVTHRIH